MIEDYANGQRTPGANLEVKLENIRLTEDRFRYVEIYTNVNGASAVSTVYHLPVAQTDVSNGLHPYQCE